MARITHHRLVVVCRESGSDDLFHLLDGEFHRLSDACFVVVCREFGSDDFLEFLDPKVYLRLRATLFFVLFNSRVIGLPVCFYFYVSVRSRTPLGCFGGIG